MHGLQYRNKYANLFALFGEPPSLYKPGFSTIFVESLQGQGGARFYASRPYFNIKIMLGK